MKSIYEELIYGSANEGNFLSDFGNFLLKNRSNANSVKKSSKYDVLFTESELNTIRNNSYVRHIVEICNSAISKAKEKRFSDVFTIEIDGAKNADGTINLDICSGRYFEIVENDEFTQFQLNKLIKDYKDFLAKLTSDISIYRKKNNLPGNLYVKEYTDDETDEVYLYVKWDNIPKSFVIRD